MTSRTLSGAPYPNKDATVGFLGMSGRNILQIRSKRLPLQSLSTFSVRGKTRTKIKIK